MISIPIQLDTATLTDAEIVEVSRNKSYEIFHFITEIEKADSRKELINIWLLNTPLAHHFL